MEKNKNNFFNITIMKEISNYQSNMSEKAMIMSLD